MKLVHRKHNISSEVRSRGSLRSNFSPPQITASVLEAVTAIWTESKRQKLPLYLFLAMCFNLVVAPLVLAANNDMLGRTQAWALGLLGMVTVGLSIYLFFVMFVPERF